MRRIADTQRGCFSRHQPAKFPINHLPKGEIYIGKDSVGRKSLVFAFTVGLGHLRRAAVLGFTKGYHD